MINDMHHLALVEVSVTYLRLLLKHHDLHEFLSTNPSIRAEIIQHQIEQSNDAITISIFSSLVIDMPEKNAK